MSIFAATSHNTHRPFLSRNRQKREPLVVGMSRGVLILAGRSRIASWLRGFVSNWLPNSHDNVVRLLQAGWPAPMLRDMTIGRRKSAVFANFGPPRAAALRGTIRLVGSKRDYWNAETWYYPVDVKRGFALSVTFDEDETVCDAEFFSMPEVVVYA